MSDTPAVVRETTVPNARAWAAARTTPAVTAALTMIVADIDLSYWDDTRRHMHRDEWLTWVRREVEAWFVRAALDAGKQR